MVTTSPHGKRMLMGIVFIYTCPADSKIKEKMLYASTRAAVVATVENECGLRIQKRVRFLSSSSHR